ncbi:MAG TPA: vWA domain-containing protein [Candidatus Limnocylindrales bacterium]|nr:vWA domain-containing protein [Candidatus Limnocylindrales bacterium]
MASPQDPQHPDPRQPQEDGPASPPHGEREARTGRTGKPAIEDPLADAFPVARTGTAFLLSAAIHVGLLLVLGTIGVAVVQQVQRINVEIREPAPDTTESELETGLPSLRDLAGELRPQHVPTRSAGSVSGPSFGSPTPGPAPAASVRSVEMPRIGGIGPTIGSSPGTLENVPLSIGGSGLAGGAPGPGGGFGDVLGGLRKVGIDLAILVDTTDSMESVLDNVKSEMQQFIGELQRMVPASRVAVVAYRDKKDEYTTKWVDFSFHTDKVQKFVSQLHSGGGGDYHEAVKEAFQSALDDLTWRKTARRFIILIGSSPPHPESMPELLSLVAEFKKSNGAVGAIDVSARLHDEYSRKLWAHFHPGEPYKPSPMPDFYKEVAGTYRQIAKAGDGEIVALGEEKSLLRQVMILTFGSRWQVEMAAFLGRLK